MCAAKFPSKELLDQVKGVRRPTQLLYCSKSKPVFFEFMITGTHLFWSDPSSKQGKAGLQALSKPWQPGCPEIKGLGVLDLIHVTSIVFGQRSARFKRCSKRPEKLDKWSFSIMFREPLAPAEDSIDVVCKDEQEFQLWTRAIQALVDLKAPELRQQLKERVDQELGLDGGESSSSDEDSDSSGSASDDSSSGSSEESSDSDDGPPPDDGEDEEAEEKAGLQKHAAKVRKLRQKSTEDDSEAPPPEISDDDDTPSQGGDDDSADDSDKRRKRLPPKKDRKASDSPKEAKKKKSKRSPPASPSLVGTPASATELLAGEQRNPLLEQLEPEAFAVQTKPRGLTIMRQPTLSELGLDPEAAGGSSSAADGDADAKLRKHKKKAEKHSKKPKQRRDSTGGGGLGAAAVLGGSKKKALAFEEANDLYSWGWNRWSQTGHYVRPALISTAAASAAAAALSSKKDREKDRERKADPASKADPAADNDFEAGSGGLAGSPGASSGRRGSAGDAGLDLDGTGSDADEADDDDGSATSQLGPAIIRQPKLLETLLGTGLVSVKGGWAHTLAVSDAGAVIGMGVGLANGLGHDALERPATVQPLKSKPSTTASPAGSKQALSASVSSSALAGATGSSPAPLPSELQYLPASASPLFPQMVPVSGPRLWSGVSIVAISCGSFHSLALDSEGRLYSWGCNLNGQLGHGHRLDIKHPSQIRLPAAGPADADPDADGELRFVQVECGSMFSTALSSRQTVWSWGSPQFGALGHGGEDLREDVLVPRRVEALTGKGIRMLSAGDFHAIAGSDSECYSWGLNASRQLGHGQNSSSSAGGGEGLQFVSTPQIVPELRGRQVISLSCGAAHTAAIVATEASGRALYTWGANHVGQCGYNRLHTTLKEPTVHRGLEKDSPMVSVCCGAVHTAVRFASGEIYVCGSNRYGQLGVETVDDAVFDFIPVSGFGDTKAVSVDAGALSTLVLSPRTWRDDSEAPNCMGCKSLFTFRNRRHHCRKCGGIFCGKCSDKRIVLLKSGSTTPQRVCDACYKAEMGS